MIHEYQTPMCCNVLMQLKNAMGHSFADYFIFHCDDCGRIKLYSRDALDRFVEVDE